MAEIVSSLRTPRMIMLGVIYFLVATATIATTRIGDSVAILWAATAILIAELNITPRERWLPPLITCGIGSFFATALFGFGVWAALPLVFVNLAEAVIAVLVMRRLNSDSNRLETTRTLAIFFFAAGIVAPAITALGGAFFSFMSGQAYWINWQRWYLGHALGAFTYTPIAFLLINGGLQRWYDGASKRDLLYMVAIMALVMAISLAVFMQSHVPLLFLPMLPVMIATFRFGRLGAASAVALLSIVGGVATTLGQGPVVLLQVAKEQQLQFFQFYLAATILTALPVAVDLSHRKRLLRELRDSEARFRMLAQKSSDVVLNVCKDGLIRFASPSIAKLGNYNPDRLIGKPALDLLHADYVDVMKRAHRIAIARPEDTQIIEYRAQDYAGREIWLESHMQGVIDDDGNPDGVVSTIRDITHRKVKEAQLIIEAERDSLTGIANRRCFLRALNKRLANWSVAQEGCIALFDLDHFKQVNDLHGHATGDAVLKKFTSVTTGAIGPDDLMGRLGGEEFGILMPDCTLEQAYEMCEHIRRRVEALDLRDKEGERIKVTVSAGISSLRKGMRPEELLAHADAALYAAKAAGRNRLQLAA